MPPYDDTGDFFTESDTRAKLIDPAIHLRGWTEGHIRREQTAGSIELTEDGAERLAPGRLCLCGGEASGGHIHFECALPIRT